MGGGRESQFETPVGFLKYASSRERVKLWFFVNFSNIISHIFPENFIEVLQIVQNI